LEKTRATNLKVTLRRNVSMRIKISLAAIALLTFAVVGAYFTPDLRRLWSVPDNPAVKVVQPKPLDAEEKEADARKKLAFVSLIERLPKGKAITPAKALNAEAKKRWEILDGNLAANQDERAGLLKALHEKTRRFFVESPGAGFSRNIVIPPEHILLYDYESDLPQPGEPAGFPVSPGETLTRVNPDSELHLQHKSELNNFLYPGGFGYVKDRGNVAGFKSHRFRWKPGSSQRWSIQHVQLVGILTHEEPVVYLTDKLPSMEQVRQGKIRPLDFFEEVALPSLRDGEDLYIVSKDNTLRMLGALRATKTCQKCHDAEIGDLLGAFSYTLRPAPKDKNVDH
jgi:hypothetical protein